MHLELHGEGHLVDLVVLRQRQVRAQVVHQQAVTVLEFLLCAVVVLQQES